MQVSYVRTSKTGADLWALPLDGGEPSPILVTPFDEVGGQFSPDGRWVAYTSKSPIGIVLNWDAVLRKP